MSKKVISSQTEDEYLEDMPTGKTWTDTKRQVSGTVVDNVQSFGDLESMMFQSKLLFHEFPLVEASSKSCCSNLRLQWTPWVREWFVLPKIAKYHHVCDSKNPAKGNGHHHDEFQGVQPWN
jgi:hypothetical protein